MKLLYVKFFQPIVYTVGSGTTTATSVTNKEHDVVLNPKTNLIKITHRSSGQSTYSSLFNMQWMREDDTDTKAATSSKGSGETQV